MTTAWEIRLCDSLEKVFSDAVPRPLNNALALSAFLGETLSLQIAIRAPHTATIEVHASCAGAEVELFEVRQVPVSLPWRDAHDEHYLRLETGNYPDLLRPLTGAPLGLEAGQWQAIWVPLRVEPTDSPGDPAIMPHELNLHVRQAGGELIWESSLAVEIINVKLAELPIVSTHWLHADSIAEYYGQKRIGDLRHGRGHPTAHLRLGHPRHRRSLPRISHRAHPRTTRCSR